MEENPQMRATLRSNRSGSQPNLNLNQMGDSQIGMVPLFQLSLLY